ncbi:hypothetical protein [Bergeyella zoohelcum]|nr:hypothetical protein [Bergeyella zoohelcum]
MSTKKIRLFRVNQLDFLTAMKSLPEWEDLYQDINELVKAARNS